MLLKLREIGIVNAERFEMLHGVMEIAGARSPMPAGSRRSMNDLSHRAVSRIKINEMRCIIERKGGNIVALLFRAGVGVGDVTMTARGEFNCEGHGRQKVGHETSTKAERMSCFNRRYGNCAKRKLRRIGFRQRGVKTKRGSTAGAP